MREKNGHSRLFIAIPVYNDWDSAKVLIERIDAAFRNKPVQLSLLLINDGSSIPLPDNFIHTPLSSISNIDLLHLRRNLGHQRSIAIALTYIFKSQSCDAVIVMDGDGEDRPEDTIPLLNQYEERNYNEIIFAKRKKRMEGFLFKLCYRCYQVIHRVLTGHSIRVGNFSIIPFHHLSPLVVSSELWNHYAASVYKLQIPYSMLPIARGKRISGKSKMNFIALVIHGLSAISVFGEIVGTRIFIAACGINIVLISALTVVIMTRVFTSLAIPGWATFSSGLLLILFLQIMTAAASFLFFVLNNRNMASFLPLRDYSLFIHKTQRIFSRHD